MRVLGRLTLASALALAVASWTLPASPRIGDALAACELQPCDCKGPFAHQPMKITAEELESRVTAHHGWLAGEFADQEYWTIDNQFKQYDTTYNPPDEVSNYKCTRNRNGPNAFDEVDVNIDRDGSLGSFPNEDLKRACFRKADLRGANFNGAKLQGANFYKADLSRASLIEADLTGAILDCANLRGADFTRATLTGANLYRTLLGGTFFNHAELGQARFEPIEVPPVRNLWEARGLEELQWSQDPGGLFALREELRASGLEYQARRATYAIEHRSTVERLDKWDEDVSSAFIGLLRLLFIDWTTGYGLYPFRALGILFTFVGVFAVIYTVPLATAAAGIYRIWPNGRLETPPDGARLAGRAEVERLRPQGLLAVLGRGLQFSLLCAFDLGWRELNVGSWLARVQAHEYTLRATGWVRAIAGVQSLISVYLLAIWALTYFGQPF